MNGITQALGIEGVTPTNLSKYISVAAKETTEYSAKATVADGVAQFYSDTGDIGTVKVAIEPKQEGAGDATPQNVRRITGWTAGKITISKTTGDQDSRIYNVDWASVAGEVYGGILDTAKRILTVTTVKRRVNASLGTVNFNTTRVRYTVHDMRPANTNEAFENKNYLCDTFPKVVTSSSASGCAFSHGGDYANAFIIFHNIRNFGIENTLEAWNAFLDANEVYVTYELASQIVYDVEVADVAAFPGQNYVWADCGPIVEVHY